MQKTKKFRRLLAGGVAVLMLGVSVPVAAFATGDDTNSINFEFYEGEQSDTSYIFDGEASAVIPDNVDPDVEYTVPEIVELTGVSLPEGYEEWTVVDTGMTYPIESGMTIAVVLQEPVEEPSQPTSVTINYVYEGNIIYSTSAPADEYGMYKIVSDETKAILEEKGYTCTVTGDGNLYSPEYEATTNT